MVQHMTLKSTVGRNIKSSNNENAVVHVNRYDAESLKRVSNHNNRIIIFPNSTSTISVFYHGLMIPCRVYINCPGTLARPYLCLITRQPLILPITSLALSFSCFGVAFSSCFHCLWSVVTLGTYADSCIVLSSNHRCYIIIS